MCVCVGLLLVVSTGRTQQREVKRDLPGRNLLFAPTSNSNGGDEKTGDPKFWCRQKE